jgi:hypothetical protein
MKQVNQTAVRVALLAIVGVLLSSGPARGETPPVELSYAESFDEVCAQQTHYHISPSWIAEAKSRLPEFTASWQQSGSRLLRTSEQIVGKDFRQKQFLVSLSVCSFPSMAEPLLVNIRYSLKSFTPESLPADVTVSIIFHEILHHYLSGLVLTHSNLLLKYRAEDETVTSHVHLLALQKAVYLRLGLSDTLMRVVSKDESLPNKSYKRAWEIVNDLENYQSFVTELRQ